MSTHTASHAGVSVSNRRAIIAPGHRQALLADLDRQRRRLQDGFAERLREARGFGDPADNDEYLQIKEEEAVLAAGIAQIAALLETADVIDDTTAQPGVASLGSRVEVEDRSTGGRATHRLISGHELRLPDAVSAGSPIGQALMGRRAGDVADVALPRGRQRKLRVIAVTP